MTDCTPLNPAQVGVSHGAGGAGGGEGGEGVGGDRVLTLSGADVSDQPKPKVFEP